MAKCILFVEGSPSTENGNLRRGFQRLFAQEIRLRGQMPRIEMSNDTAEAVRKFKFELGKPFADFDNILLLVDLDGPPDTQEKWLVKYELQHHRGQVFWMVQEMEAWFIAQPQIITSFYGPKLAHVLPLTAPTRIINPADKLEYSTKSHPTKGTYAKVKHGAQLLELLNLAKLQADFPDVARLVAAL